MEKKLAASRSNFIRETLLPLYFRYILIFNLQTTVQIKKSIKKHIRRNEIKLLNSVVESLLLSPVLIKVVIHLYSESIKKRTSLISEFTPLEIATESCVANEDCFANLSIYRNFFFLHLLLNCNSGTVLDGWVCSRRYPPINRTSMVKGIKMIDLCSTQHTFSVLNKIYNTTISFNRFIKQYIELEVLWFLF